MLPPSYPLTAPGPIGPIELLVDEPAGAPQALAIVAHPHPLFGGANTNKVTHTLARAHAAAGALTLRPNFRGVGGSAGQHDHGNGETEDLLALIAWALAQWQLPPICYLAGFSFGAFVTVQVARRLLGIDPAPTPLPTVTLPLIILVGLPHGLALGSGTVYETPELPADQPALIIHGEADQVAALARALDWARPQARPVTVIPGADHFFHGKLTVVATLVRQMLASATPARCR